MRMSAGQLGRLRSLPRPIWALCVVVLVALSGVGVYLVLERSGGPPGPFAWSWSIGRAGCTQCSPSTTLLASNSSSLFVLQEGNITLYGNVSYRLSAYTWTNGMEVWPSLSIEIGEGAFASFDQAWGGHADLLSGGGVVCVVTLGTWVRVSGELVGQPASPDTPNVWILEWNATTGAFLRAQQSAGIDWWPFPSVFVSQDEGWLAVGVLQAPNITISTFQIDSSSIAYGEWNATVSEGVLSAALFVSLDLNMSGGYVSLALMGNVNLAVVLSGRSGSLVWEGDIPSLFIVPGNANWTLIPWVVGEFTNVVRSGATFYYIANESGATDLNAYNTSTNVTSMLASLSGGVDPIDSQLSLIDGQALVVTDAFAERYWAFSLTGASLWNRTLELSQISTTGITSVGGIDTSPLTLGRSNVLLCSMWSWDSSSYNNQNYPTSTFTIPLAVVDWETGQVTWESSYTQSETLGGVQNHPVTYWPLLTDGRFAAFDYYPGGGLGWILAITEFQSIPP